MQPKCFQTVHRLRGADDCSPPLRLRCGVVISGERRLADRVGDTHAAANVGAEVVADVAADLVGDTVTAVVAADRVGDTPAAADVGAEFVAFWAADLFGDTDTAELGSQENVDWQMTFFDSCKNCINTMLAALLFTC